jgi:hypothetical protein
MPLRFYNKVLCHQGGGFSVQAEGEWSVPVRDELIEGPTTPGRHFPRQNEAPLHDFRPANVAPGCFQHAQNDFLAVQHLLNLS